MDTDSSPDRQDAAEAFIEEEAAQIDARSPDAPEEIADVIQDAGQVGLHPHLPDDVDLPDTE